MTFILTVLCESPTDGAFHPGQMSFLARPVGEDHKGWARAGYVPGLRRHLNYGVSGKAFQVVMDEGDGYETSNFCFPYPDDEECPVSLQIPDEHRANFHQLLHELLRRSSRSRVLVVSEYNGAVTAPDSQEEVDVLGPVDLDGFWRLHDLQQIEEESIVILEDNPS